MPTVIAPPSTVSRKSNARYPILLPSDLDTTLHETLYDLFVDEGYHVCAPRDHAEGLALLRSGHCGAIVFVSLPPVSVENPCGWLSALSDAQAAEPLVGLRLRKHCALIGLATGIHTFDGGKRSAQGISPLWGNLSARWSATLAVPCDLDALLGTIMQAASHLQCAA